MAHRRRTLPLTALCTLWLACSIIGSAGAYWHGECNSPSFEKIWAESPENRPLDCALRKLGLEYARKTLAESRHLDMILPRVHRAFNLSMCGEPLPPPRRSQQHPRGPETVRAAAAVAVGRREIFVSRTGSDSSGDGSDAKPFATVDKAQHTARSTPGGAVVWLRQGTHFQASAPLTLTTADAGCTYAGYPGEDATLSGSIAALPADLQWKPVHPGARASLGLRESGPTVFRAALPPEFVATKFVGLTANGVRLPRARYPNCDDITGTDCYRLNASAPTSSPQAPTVALSDIPGGMNLNVVNQNGIDMFADRWDNDQSEGAHGASDSTLPKDTNRTVVVQHPDFAWRCHEDCGWKAYSHWKSILCIAEGSMPLARKYGDAPKTGCRHDTTYNDNYWQQDVSGGFLYNVTEGWTTQKWRNASTGVVHMYQTARWGGWQFQLAERNDTEHSLDFLCTPLEQHEDGFYMPIAGKSPGPCSKIESVGRFQIATSLTTNPPARGGQRGRSGVGRGGQIPRPNAMVHGGWQEGRGSAIGPQYTNQKFNNSYFIENIKEELDYEGEWFLDVQEGALYIIPPAGKNIDSLLLVPVHRPTVVEVRGDAKAPVKGVTVANLTIAHAAATFLEPYEVSSGGDWAIHRGAAVFIDGAHDVHVEGNHFDQVDGNGLFLSRHVRNCSVRLNAMTDIGDSGILVVGASGAHRTYQATNLNYPAYNTIEKNYIGNNGVWSKQTAAYYKSVARENYVLDNVFHDGPRSGVNYNDGAMGGEVMRGNMLLNYVKESNDHGPFNSWDRQPYIYRLNESQTDGKGELRISPQTQTIANNLIYTVNFNGQACGSIGLDHDDESSQYNDTDNVLVFGGIKYFDGINRTSTKNLIIMPGLFGAIRSCLSLPVGLSGRNLSGHFSHFVDNTCVQPHDGFPYQCVGSPFYNKTDRVDVRDNVFYRLNATAAEVHDWGHACGCWPNPKSGAGPCPYKNFSQWQDNGHDTGSRIETQLPLDRLLTLARIKLGMH